MSRSKTIALVAGTVLVVVLFYQWLVQFRRADTVGVPALVVPTGAYSDLTAPQRRLIDDWVDRLNRAGEKKVTAALLYEELALSTRTAFTAVTHALSQTPLTDQSGQSMNLTAMDLIARLDAVAGSIPGAGGDKQFRLYVQLRPDARKTLESSREFSRQVDNTVYHKGFPICFRGAGGTPSIQFSLSPDAARADIDVDYRSSAFPLMLMNGHLTSSNSDVRAGNNSDRHNSHWAGLTSWWRGFMGLPQFEAPRAEAADLAASAATAPRLGPDAAPEVAVRDFLNAWLVEQQPSIAAGYLADRAFSCIEAEGGVAVDRGVARFQLVRAMRSVNATIGTTARLAEAIEGVALTGGRGRERPQPNRSEFVMYDFREDLAESLDCENRLHPDQADPEKAQSQAFGKYIGIVFRLKSRLVTGETVALVWAEDKSGWRLVSYAVEPEAKAATIPNAVTVEVAAVQTDPGNPEMIRSAGDFLRAWFVRKDVPVAFGFLSPSSYGCYSIYQQEDGAVSDADAGRLIQERMKMLADWTGPATRLDDALIAAEAQHVEFRRVAHGDAAAFSILALPDSAGDALQCARMSSGRATTDTGQASPATYGRYYAASIRLKRAGADAAVLWTVWEKSGSTWKVVAYHVLTP